jgi:hypothetical protein
MTQDVNLRESECRTKSSQFFDEPLNAPQIDVSRFVSPSGPELVVEYNRSFICKLFEWVQVVTGRTWASMEQHNWSASSGADDAVPDATPWDIDMAFTRLQARAPA